MESLIVAYSWKMRHVTYPLILLVLVGAIAILVYASGAEDRKLTARVELVTVGASMDGVREIVGREPDSVIIDEHGRITWVYYVVPSSWLHNIRFDEEQRVASVESFLF